MHQLLDPIFQQGIQLWAKDDNLCVRAPRGVLTPEIQKILSQHKLEILAWLKLDAHQEKATTVNWASEATLESSIVPLKAWRLPMLEPSHIFLTGGTGFLGAFLLHDLLHHTNAKIHCLVRAKDSQTGQQRLQANLDSYHLWHPEWCDRIIPVLGDLTQPKLGLSAQQFQTLAEQSDVIYHSAALLNWVYPYAALKESNVLGTQEVLRLACQERLKPVHYISTVAVFESSAYTNCIVTELDEPDHGEGIHLGYSQSKWVAEKLVLAARDRGIPVCVYRAPLIAGHSQTGCWYTDDFVCRMIKGCIEMGAFPALDYQFDMAPVDYISQSIVSLASRHDSLGKTFHLMNPQRTHLRQFVACLQAIGYAVKLLPYAEWLEQLKDPGLSQTHSLKPLLPFFTKRWSASNLTLPELYQQCFKPQFNCEKTIATLAESAINCPSIDAALLEIYFSHFIQRGFIQPPQPRTFKNTNWQLTS